MEAFAIVLLLINSFVLLKIFEHISKRMSKIEKELRDMKFLIKTGLTSSQAKELYEDVFKDFEKII